MALARAVNEDRYAPATKHLAALRGRSKAAWRLGMLDTEDYLRAVDLGPAAGSHLPAGRDVEAAELAALLACCACDHSPAGVRDAVVAPAYLSGTRRAEVRRRCVWSQGRQAAPHAPLPHRRSLLAAWLDVRGTSSGPLFCPDRPGWSAAGRPLVHISPHDPRRTCGGDLLDAAADLPAVSAAPRARVTGDNPALRPAGWTEPGEQQASVSTSCCPWQTGARGDQ